MTMKRILLVLLPLLLLASCKKESKVAVISPTISPCTAMVLTAPAILSCI